MMPSLFLIYLPILVALSVGFFTFSFFKNSAFFVRSNAVWFAVSNFIIHGLSLFVGGSLGLLLSIQINRFYFDFKVLEAALPNGVIVWYGFGPAPTPQFMSYWVYVQFTCFVAFVGLVVLSYRDRRKQILRRAD